MKDTGKDNRKIVTRHASLVTQEYGTLYVVSTPIGNMEDITLRALRVLKGVELIAAENVRHTQRLCGHYDIKSQLTQYNQHNQKAKAHALIEELKSGKDLALVTDAGTPGISDPGAYLTDRAAREGIRITPIPGPSAVITALCAAGLPTDAFVFVGFPARKKNKRLGEINKLRLEERTIIFYESPRRLPAFLAELLTVFGDRQAVLSRELTKFHEEFLRGRISEILSVLSRRPSVKGECTLLVIGRPQEPRTISPVLQEELQHRRIAGHDRLGDLPARYLVARCQLV